MSAVKGRRREEQGTLFHVHSPLVSSHSLHPLLLRPREHSFDRRKIAIKCLIFRYVESNFIICHLTWLHQNAITPPRILLKVAGAAAAMMEWLSSGVSLVT